MVIHLSSHVKICLGYVQVYLSVSLKAPTISLLREVWVPGFILKIDKYILSPFWPNNAAMSNGNIEEEKNYMLMR